MQKNYQKLIRLADTLSMRHMDNFAIDEIGINGLVLMENAARSVVDWLNENKLKNEPFSKIVVCCGRGNNGGDGFAAARLLSNRGFSVSVVDAGISKKKDARENQIIWEKFGESASFPDLNATRLIEEADVLIDAIFGIGIDQDLDGAYREWIEIFNLNKKALKIAVDIPSGVSTDDSKIFGIATKCDHTITFQKGKPGCYQYPGAKYCGKVHIYDISIPDSWKEKDLAENEVNTKKRNYRKTFLLCNDFINDLLPKREPDSHKGSLGHLLTICGSLGMSGAVSLSSLGALKSGAGLVTACVPNKLVDNLPGQTSEIITASPKHALEYFSEEHADFAEQLALVCDAVILGCGLGVNSQTAKFVQRLSKHIKGPLLIDADGLNNLENENLIERLDLCIITPHPLELSRLCGKSVTEIQENRIATVRQLSQEWNVVLLLKGAYSVIGIPNGDIYINPTGNSALSTAGSGDVLSGIIGGFLAQGLSPLEATLLGAFIHGLSAECYTHLKKSEQMIASNIFEGLPIAINQIQNKNIFDTNC